MVIKRGLLHTHEGATGSLIKPTVYFQTTLADVLLDGLMGRTYLLVSLGDFVIYARNVDELLCGLEDVLAR